MRLESEDLIVCRLVDALVERGLEDAAVRVFFTFVSGRLPSRALLPIGV